MPDYKIIHNDCLIAMKEMEDNSIDFIVTDPPYGISFMSKKWDQQIPPPEYWKEMLRICKPGSYMACAGLPRMMHRLTSIVEDSGWVIRDMIIQIFGSGFPKSNNFGKKLGEPWSGYGTALKPAWEGWTLAMKPLDGTFAHNAEKWGVGGINIDASRVQTKPRETHSDGNHTGNNKIYGKIGEGFQGNGANARWPANLILSEESAEELDKMTGVLKGSSGRKQIHTKDTSDIYQSGLKTNDKIVGYDECGGASRFFYCAKASSSERNKGLEGMPLKEGKRTLSGGVMKGNEEHGSHKLEKRQNTHPTVKPIALMKYIITLLAPPGNPICLDMFMGSGSTGVACKELSISFIGIEKEKEYVEIATKRLDAAQCPSQKQMEMFD